MNHEIRVKWLRGEAEGTVDVLPVNLFNKVLQDRVSAHVVELGPSEAEFAKFNLRVHRRSATLDYAAHRSFNLKRKMSPGAYNLEFADNARTQLSALQWNGKKLYRKDVVFGTVPIGKGAPPRLRPDGARRGKGARFGVPEQNALVEKAAVKAVRVRLASEGWIVRSVESSKVGYDLDCVNGKKSRHVEVKGIRGTKVTMLLTAGERKQAIEDPDFHLYAVTNALSKPRLHHFAGMELEDHFEFSTIKWRLDPL